MKLTSLVVAATVVLLAACGGSNSRDDFRPPVLPAPAPAPAPAPVPMLDAFFSFVSSLVNGPEDAEPQSVDSASPTAPEDTEPATVGS